MNIRRAEEKDIPGMLSLLRQVGQVHHHIRPDIFPETTLKYDETALLELLKDENIKNDEVRCVRNMKILLKN